MTGSVRPDLLVRAKDGQWRSPSESEYGNEAQLRDLLAAQPSLIPGLTADASAVIELAAPGTGFLDVAAVSQDGEIALVECKLASNPEIRRQVIGQLLAYAAAFWRMDVATFEGNWHRRAGKSLTTSVLGAEHDQDAATRLREAVASTLDGGRFSLVLAVDSITAELRRTVEYLNAHTLGELSVLALEIHYAREGDTEMILPRVFGAELAEAITRPSHGRRGWTEADLFDHLRLDSAQSEVIARRLFDHYRDRASVIWYGDGRRPNATATFETSNGPTQPWSIYTGDPSGIATNFQWTNAFSREARRAYVDAIVRIAGVNLDPDEIDKADFRRRPTLPIPGVWDKPGAIDRLIEAVDALLSSPVVADRL